MKLPTAFVAYAQLASSRAASAADGPIEPKCPQGGTPLMQRTRTAGIDRPLEALGGLPEAAVAR